MARQYLPRHDRGRVLVPDAIQHKLWIVCVRDLLYSILFTWVYVRGTSLNDYVTYRLHHVLVIKWIAAGFITSIVMGLASAQF
jgi:hypothetical protein